MSVETAQTAAPTSAAPASPAASATIGSAIDAEIVLVKSRIAKLESAGKTDWAVIVAWAKSNWAHIALTWPAAVAVLAPVVKKLI